MKLLKHIPGVLAFLVLNVFSLNAQATTVDIVAATCGTVVGQICADKPTDRAKGKDTTLFPILSGLDLLYKADTRDKDPVTDLPILTSVPGEEDGIYKDSYSTVFGWKNLSGDDKPNDGYSTAHISYDGAPDSPITECLSGNCYLIVKGGLGFSPSAYLFNLALNGWDGDVNRDMPIDLRGFWSGATNNSMSHVAIYGTVSAIPVPAAFWLFGTALLVFIGLSRSTRV